MIDESRLRVEYKEYVHEAFYEGKHIMGYEEFKKIYKTHKKKK